MNRIETKGLILRSCTYGEANKMLTVLTAEHGKISVAVKGGKSLKRGAFLNNFCYCDFVLIKRSDVFSLSSAQPVENFFGISKSVERLFAASAIASFAAYICGEGTPCGNMLRLCLNSIYALAELDANPQKILVAFYIKAAKLMGYSPEVNQCLGCGETDELYFFSPLLGGVVCKKCAKGEPPIEGNGLEIMRYVLRADMKNMIKFNASETELENLHSLMKLFSAEHFDYKPKDWKTL